MRLGGKIIVFTLLSGSALAQTAYPPGVGSHRKPQYPGANQPPASQVETPAQSVPTSTPQATLSTPQSHTSQSAPVPLTAPASKLAHTTSSVPASAPRISYQNGELTVVAENSSLTEILFAIRAATGVKIEGAGGNSDRVVAQIGPAPVRDVLLSLLEGSRYDFAMLGSATDPQSVERLVLSARVPANGSANGANALAQQQQPVQDPTNADPAIAGEEDDNEGFAEAPKPATPPTVKTPEQLLEDLKRMEADKAAQQQQQQNQQPADPNAPRPKRPDRPK